MQAGTRFTYPGGMEVDLVDLIAPGPGVEPATFRPRVRRRRCTRCIITYNRYNKCDVFFSYQHRSSDVELLLVLGDEDMRLNKVPPVIRLDLA